MSLSLAACGGGSTPSTGVQQPSTPAPVAIDLKTPDSFVLEAGSDSDFEIFVNEGVTYPTPAYDVSVVFPEVSGLTLAQTGPIGYSGRRVLTIRAEVLAPVGTVKGVITVTMGTSSRSVPITVTVSAKSPGSFYSTFGQNGLATLSLPSGASINYASDVVVDTQNRILVLGYTQVSRGTDTAFTITRFSKTGQLDSSYGTNGTVLVNPTEGEEVGQRLFLTPDGRLLVPGIYSGRFGVVRLTVDGAIDSSYGVQGLLQFSATPFPALSTAQSAQGKVLLAFSTISADTVTLTQLNADGTLDNSFSSTIIATGSPSRSYAQVQYLNSGEVVLATIESGDNQNIRLRKFGPDGQPNSNFGSQGQISVDLGSSQDTLNAFLITPQDKMFLLGRTRNLNPVLVQLSKDGDRVGSFGTNGQVVLTDDQDVRFDDIIWNGTDAVLYDEYTSIDSIAAKVNSAGIVSRFVFKRPLRIGNDLTTLTRILWSQRLGHYLGFGDFNNYSAGGSKGAVYAFAP